MKLRKLQCKDAPLMLEWMHDESVVRYLSANFTSKTIEDCQRFIENSQYSQTDLNLAIVDEDDTYMGTVSLKHIDSIRKTAEFAVTIRAIAMGKGYSKYGMKEILRIGLDEIGLDAIFWCVSKENNRAVRFYDKNNYKRVQDVPEQIKEHYSLEQIEQFAWYVCDESDI